MIKTKTFYTAIIMCVVAMTSFGQEKKVVLSENEFWYKLNAEKVAKVGLVNLTQSKDAYHWRLGYYGPYISYFIDLIKDKDSVLHSVATIYTMENVDADEEPTNRVFSKSYNLDKYADSILLLIQNSKIADIPSEKEIKGWGDIIGLDGDTYAMEYSTRDAYIYKSYWSPFYIKVKEAITISQFIKCLKSTINWNGCYPDFEKSIPFVSYNTGGSGAAIKILSKKELRKRRKEREDYRQSQKANATPAEK